MYFAVIFILFINLRWARVFLHLSMVKGGVKLPPSVSQDLRHLGKKFQRLFSCFRGRETQWRYREGSIIKPEVRNSRWWLITGCTYISVSIQDSKEIPTAIPCIRDRGFQWCYQEGFMSKPEVRNSRWQLPNRIYLYLSLYARWPKKFQQLSICFG